MVKRIVLHQEGGIHADCTGHTCALWDVCTSWSEAAALVRHRAGKRSEQELKFFVSVEWADGTTWDYGFSGKGAHLFEATPITSVLDSELKMQAGVLSGVPAGGLSGAAIKILNADYDCGRGATL